MYGSFKRGYSIRMRHFTILIIACLLFSTVAPAYADNNSEGRYGYKRDDDHDHDHDHDRVRRAVERGEILPLSDILKRANSEYPGQLIEAELEDEDGQIVYELVIISGDGRVFKLYYNARNGDLLKIKGRNKRE